MTAIMLPGCPPAEGDCDGNCVECIRVELAAIDDHRADTLARMVRCAKSIGVSLPLADDGAIPG